MLAKLMDLWVLQPDTRLCQLILNTVPRDFCDDCYFVEDDKMEAAIDAAFERHLHFVQERDRN